ncbi:MAG: hypothetical protein LBC68_14720 [Prevotellaceae bacterium]|jgi:hypothetical protein|nr:hypothetical protein [Prevotellaceae bacterium]
MKKNIIILICVCSIIILQSCASEHIVKGKFSAVAPKNEIVVSPELREFLTKNPNPRVVLRVPSTTSSITASESEKNSQYNSLYGRIEKELMKEGYTVRDRNLLNNLLSSGQNLSYKEIGEKVQTDIIIEIVSINSSKISDNNKKIKIEEDISVHGKNNSSALSILFFDFTNDLSQHSKAMNDINAQMNNAFSVNSYTVDCKIILVNEGTTVGMFTFNYCRCNENDPCAVEIRTYRKGRSYYLYPDSDDGIIRVEGDIDTRWLYRINYQSELNDISEILTRDLVNILRGK